jgi:hypothetical protein
MYNEPTNPQVTLTRHKHYACNIKAYVLGNFPMTVIYTLKLFTALVPECYRTFLGEKSNKTCLCVSSFHYCIMNQSV